MIEVINYFSEFKTKLLLVESNEAIIKNLEPLLTDFQFDLSIIRRDYHVKKILHELSPRIIIINISLTSNDGIKIAKQFKKLKNVFVILIGDFKENYNLMRDAIDSRVDAFLSTPIAVNELIEALRKFTVADKIQRELFIEKQYDTVVRDNYIISKTDTDGIIIDVNEQFCEVSGYSKEELIGQSHSIIHHPNTLNSMVKRLWNTIKSGKVFKSNIKNKGKNGIYILDAVIAPIFGRDGLIREYISISNDVTKIELLKEKSFASEKKQAVIEQELRVKSDFLTVFTHELKTPLNAIINFNQYIGKEIKKIDFKKKDELIELSDMVEDNSQFLLQAITDILEIQKLQAGQLNFNKTTFSLSSLIQSTIKNLDIHNDNFILETITDVSIFSDETRIRQIIYNIISNAQKYGKGTIWINLKVRDNAWQLQIEDNGDGIKSKDKVFEMYHQEDENKITRTSTGTGIGLHTVKLLCNNLSIKIRIGDGRVGGALFAIQGKICEDT